jgi:hypothetical protein
MEDNSIDSCVTDPPYGLSFMGKAWDYDVPKTEIWKEVFRVLKPGAHLLAFFGSRTYHRGVVQIEDAGFEIRDQIMWLYGSGFPKSHNNGNGWGTALKPAHEPIVVARKPITQSVAKNVLEHGTGAINIDECRVGVAPDDDVFVKNPNTIATAIRIGNPASWQQAIDARDSSGGLIDAVTDKEILAAYHLIASREGIFVEPSSAAGLAGLIKYQKAGKLPKNKTIVITVTGHGLKDIPWALEGAKKPVVVPVSVKAAAKALGLS